MKPTFTAFLRGVIACYPKDKQVELRPAQRVLTKVAFDGIDPIDLPEHEKALATSIFGGAERFTEAQRRTFNWVSGGRAGKSWLCSMRCLHLGCSFDLGRLQPGEHGFGMIVAPDVSLAGQNMDYIRGAVEQVPVLRASIAENNVTSLVLRRGPELVEFVVTAAGVKGRGQRGKSLFCGIGDEGAIFRDSKTGKINDSEIIKAMRLRVMLGGQVLWPSTPYGKAGTLWEQHERNWGHPVDCMAAWAPTILLRDEPHKLEEIRLEYIADPENAAREFGAQFMDSTASQFFDAQSIAGAAGQVGIPGEALPGDVITAGADFGFVKNTSAVVVGAWREGVYHVLAIDERKPVEGAPLRPSETVGALGRVVAGFKHDVVMADGHYREAVREHLEPAGVYLLSAPEGSDGKARVYAKVRALLREGRIKLPAHDRLLRQLREVEVKYAAGSGDRVSISSPTWSDGAHGDLVAALVLAVWQDYGATVPTPSPVLTPEEREAARGIAMEHRHLARAHEAQNPKRSVASAWRR